MRHETGSTSADLSSNTNAPKNVFLTGIPFQFAKKYGIVLMMRDNEPTVFYREVIALETIQELYRYYDQPFKLAKTNSMHFEQLLHEYYAEGKIDTAQLAKRADEETNLDELIAAIPLTDLLDDSNDAPIIKLLNGLFTQAIQQRASDIHVETFSDSMQIRFRIDGILRTVLTPQLRLAPVLCSRIKVMARLDIAEKRLPQDGRLSLSLGGHKIDVRVSTLPTNNGERIVLRVLDQKQAQLDLHALGLSSVNYQWLESLIQKPHGIILVTGPTGSGKTTTLYAILSALHDNSRNIMTIEDPIEYDLPGISQSAVNTKIQMTFARGLRSILRQDPDIVMVGEIRDTETAKIAVQASMTGHLVLSTLHTNTAVNAITRLRDMGVESYLLSSTLIGVIAERLVRKLCDVCKQAISPSVAEQKLLALSAHDKIYQPHGCEECYHTGYNGRMGLYEIFLIDEAMVRLIHTEADEVMLENAARQRCPSLLADGLMRVKEGKTSLSEVLRIVGEERECF